MTILLDEAQFSIPQGQKERLLLGELNNLTRHHTQRCPDYARLSRVFGFRPDADRLADVPYLPAALFKTHVLSSIESADVYKQLTSSGTTGQQRSHVILDRETAQRQSIALSKSMSSILGPKRLPMIIVDTKDVLKNRREHSARAAGVLGMMNFGRDHFYALDEAMNVDREGLAAFLARHSNETIFVFGFTFVIWETFGKSRLDLNLDFSRAVLVHGGGWKKLVESAVDNAAFKETLHWTTGIRRIYNFYGMVEQIGNVFLEGEDGFLYPPNAGDVVIRNPETWEEAAVGETGVIQVLSTLPTSYPGHSVLTEDLGIVHGIDDSQCGRFGKRFSVIGRLPKAELRGCSDVQAYGR